MRYLLDTHIIIWLLSDNPLLSKEVKDIVCDANNRIYYSTVSILEVELKRRRAKNFTLTGKLMGQLCDNHYLSNLPIRNEHVYAMNDIVKEKDIDHNDPFDRLLLAQCIAEDMVLITHDKKFDAYDKEHIVIV